MKRIVWLMIILLLAACSRTPGEGAIERQVAQQLYADGGDRIYRLDNFRKLSGYQKNDRTYIADIEYDLIFKKDYEQVAEDLKKQSRDNPLNALGAGMNLFALKLRYGDFKAGNIMHQEERVTLAKTDKGWILDSR